MTQSPVIAIWGFGEGEAGHEAALRRSGHPVVRLESPSSFAEGGRPVGLLIVATRGEDEGLLEALRTFRKHTPSTPLIVLGDSIGDEIAFQLGRLGVDELVPATTSQRDVAARCLSHWAESGRSQPMSEVVGASPAIVELRRCVDEAARVDSKVLILGETGTGKGLIARTIHAHSRRSSAPFVHVDCAALSPNLIESELFGHEKGAFTGAGALRRGRFELAAEGTIFLDEIGDLNPDLQSKLLRVLEDCLFERVGGSRSIPMRARVIAATSHELYAAVKEGRFRRDLYYRLNVLEFRVPPLRARGSDVALLARAGLSRIAEKLQLPVPSMSDGFVTALSDHDWPGNVRELMNLCERLLVRSRVSELRAGDLDGVLDTTAEPTEDSGLMELARGDDEAAMIASALLATGGNVARASRRLNMSRGGLRYKIRHFGLEDLIPRD